MPLHLVLIFGVWMNINQIEYLKDSGMFQLNDDDAKCQVIFSNSPVGINTTHTCDEVQREIAKAEAEDD